VDYFFLNETAFRESQQRGEFLESAEVHGSFYGTLVGPVRNALLEGFGVIMAIDVQGAAQIRSRVALLKEDDPLKSSYLDIFILPPSVEVLAQRLRSRGEDSEENIQRRLRNAENELLESTKYQFRVVNDDLDTAYGQLRAIITDERKNRSLR
jgi:guanylate kinase